MVGEFIMMNEYVDIIVLCGGKELIECFVCELCIFMIKYFDGVCYVYIDDSVDLEMVVKIVDNVKI